MNKLYICVVLKYVRSRVELLAKGNTSQHRVTQAGMSLLPGIIVTSILELLVILS